MSQIVCPGRDVTPGGRVRNVTKGADLFFVESVTGTERIDVENEIAMKADGTVPAVRIEYCVSCGFWPGRLA